jgi:hypothetical protein
MDFCWENSNNIKDFPSDILVYLKKFPYFQLLVDRILRDDLFQFFKISVYFKYARKFLPRQEV